MDMSAQCPLQPRRSASCACARRRGACTMSASDVLILCVRPCGDGFMSFREETSSFWRKRAVWFPGYFPWYTRIHTSPPPAPRVCVAYTAVYYTVYLKCALSPELCCDLQYLPLGVLPGGAALPVRGGVAVSGVSGAPLILLY